MMLSKIKSSSMAPETRSMSHQAKDLQASKASSSAATNSDREEDDDELELEDEQQQHTATSAKIDAKNRINEKAEDVDDEEENVNVGVDEDEDDDQTTSEPLNEAEADSSDTNNNSNLNNNNQPQQQQAQQQQQQQQQGKRTQGELLDIVEVSRKRRLSKDSADSLTGFIRWSFTHLDSPPFPIDPSLINSSSFSSGEQRDEGDESASEDNDESDDWSVTAHRGANGKLRAQSFRQLQVSERLLKQQVKLASGSQSVGATNLTLTSSKSNKQQVFMNNNNNDQIALNALMAASGERQAIKRARGSSSNSPELNKFSNGIAGDLSNRNKQPGYLGSVVDRLHQQRQQTRGLDSSIDASGGAANLVGGGLSHQLQQFLQQQQQQQHQQHSQLEDLVSSAVGIEENSQLALAAAIHRALVDTQNGAGSLIDSNKSTASSTESSGSTQSSAASGVAGEFVAAQKALMAAAAASGNLHLVDSLSRQRRAYNTRAALHGTTTGALNSTNATNNHLLRSAAPIGLPAAANLSLNHRLQQQQQRHAQAAAALSALASAANHQHNHLSHLGSQLHTTSNSNHNNHSAAAALLHHGSHHQQQQQQHHLSVHQHAQHQHNNHHHQNHLHNHHHQNLFAAAANLSAAAAAAAVAGNLAAASAQGSHLSPMVEFKCDTCPSSFDDRHRLMQHQSIHLELKKDWFTETPVDEVMKIFNRRRGEFLCNVCNMRFEATLEYDQHNHQVHGPRPYCCQFCGNGTRTFKCWRQYLNHLYDHRYIFSCTIDDCDFTVNRRDSLRFHIFRFHLNCHLPQNQQTQGSLQRPAFGRSLGISMAGLGGSTNHQSAGANNNNNKWLSHESARNLNVDDVDGDDDEDDLDDELIIASGPNDGDDSDNEMNVVAD